MLFSKYYLRMSPDDPPGGGGGNNPPSLNADPPPNNPPPNNEPPKPPSIWGETKVQWPDGFDETLKEEKALQPFVDKEGKFNVANIIKSYVSTKKAFGANKVSVPGKQATQADWDEFWKETIGWSTDPNDFKIEKEKDSQIDDDFMKQFAAVAHEARISPTAAQKMLAFIEGSSKTEIESEVKARTEYLKQGGENLKKDWGEAYNRKMATAVRTFKEALSDDQRKFFLDKKMENDPGLIRIFADIGERLFREGRVGKNGTTAGEPMTPSEIDQEINSIRGDKKHPFNNPHHPNFNSAQESMLDLYKRREKILSGEV